MSDKEENPNIKAFLQASHTSIYFDENWDVGIGGGLWSNGLNLSKYFIDHSHLLRKNLEGIISSKERGCTRSTANTTNTTNTTKIRAIEIGSGNGLLSCCLAAVVGDLIDSLYVTDLEDHLQLMRQTVLANSHIVKLNQNDDENVRFDTIDDRNSSNDNAGNSVNCYVMECDWGKDVSSGPLADKFDFIFGSDVAYRDYLHEPLISTLLKLSDKHTISIIGVTMTDTKPKFFTSLWEAGFRYERIPDCFMSREFRGTTFGLFVIQKR